MNESLAMACPYGGESLYFEPEPYDEALQYIEDCHVCCHPIVVTIRYSEQGSQIRLQKENE